MTIAEETKRLIRCPTCGAFPFAPKPDAMTTPTQTQIEAAHKAAMKKCREEGRIGPTATAIEAALTAAAQVGEITYSQSQLDSVVKQTWSATIERCAQVADSFVKYKGFKGLAEAIAAAIRKLKD